MSKRLAEWGRQEPVAIVQLLPRRLWTQTALQQHVPVFLRAPLPGAVNHKLLVQWQSDDDRQYYKHGVPVLLPDPEWLNLWARALAGNSSLRVPGVVLIPHDWRDERPRPESAPSVMLVQRFLGAASPPARRLAGSYLREQAIPIAEYLAWLAATPLAALDQGERQRESVRLLLERSVAQLSEAARAALGVAGLLALAPFAAEAVAGPLDELVNYSLLVRHGEQYEVAHTLIHAYARASLAPADAVVAQTAGYFMQQVEEAVGALARLGALHPHVTALVEQCRARRLWPLAIALARAIDGYLDLQGLWTERAALLGVWLEAAQRSDNRPAEGEALNLLGNVYTDQGQVAQAITHYTQALAIARQIGDLHSEGASLGNLGAAYAD
jgi:hypothetical protein